MPDGRVAGRGRSARRVRPPRGDQLERRSRRASCFLLSVVLLALFGFLLCLVGPLAGVACPPVGVRAVSDFVRHIRLPPLAEGFGPYFPVPTSCCEGGSFPSRREPAER